METKTTVEAELQVREILRQRGMKMKELAEIIEIAPETLTRALQGNPRFSTLKQIATALKLEVRDLFVLPPEKDNKDTINGFIEYEGVVYSIRSINDLDILSQKIKIQRK